MWELEIYFAAYVITGWCIGRLAIYPHTKFSNAVCASFSSRFISFRCCHPSIHPTPSFLCAPVFSIIQSLSSLHFVPVPCILFIVFHLLRVVIQSLLLFHFILLSLIFPSLYPFILLLFSFFLFWSIVITMIIFIGRAAGGAVVDNHLFEVCIDVIWYHIKDDRKLSISSRRLNYRQHRMPNWYIPPMVRPYILIQTDERRAVVISMLRSFDSSFEKN